MSWDEYEALSTDVRGEYIDGVLVVSPSASGRHQDSSLNLAIAIKHVLSPPARVREAWAWKPGSDEFVPDLMVFNDNDDHVRYEGKPHLVVEILSNDVAADIVRKAAKYAGAGLERYWIIDPEGPVVIVHELVNGVLVEQARHGAGHAVTLDLGPTTVTLDPAELLA